MFKKILSILIATLFIFASNIANADERIKMTYENGVYTMPCEVNGLRMKFIFDTGASMVSISMTEAKFMYKNGYINENDLVFRINKEDDDYNFDEIEANYKLSIIEKENEQLFKEINNFCKFKFNGLI